MESTRCIRFFVSLCAAVLVTGALAGAPSALAAQGDCSQPVTTGNSPTASDCLFILRVAVGSETCTPECICDPTGGGGATASDALLCLKFAVGQSVELNCPCPPDSTSTTSSTTVTTSSTTTSTSTTTVPDTTTTTTVPGTTTTTIGGTTTTTTGGGTTTTTIGGGTTTTTIGGGTTTTTVGGGTTTTTLGTTSCPVEAELTIVAGTREACTNNADCELGTCNTTLGRCQTETLLNTGYTGISHNADLTDNVRVKADLDCPGPGPACGECTIAGLDPEPGYCRCANDNQAVCDEPFAADADDCGGADCNCYIGPPLALSAGATPACVVNRLAADVTGTANVDEGSGETDLTLRSIVFLGEENHRPCPFCTGDTTPGDGQRDGTCVLGPNDGDPCDVDGFNHSFPAPGGDGHSLDCFPASGKNVSGQGLRIEFTQTTGTQSMTSDVFCGMTTPIQIDIFCHCGLCSGDSQIACRNDDECAAEGAGTCEPVAPLKPEPNNCSGTCVEGEGGQGLCDDAGPNDRSCDGVTRANGTGFVGCLQNVDCLEENNGLPGGAGNCTLLERRSCFPAVFDVTGEPDPVSPVGVAAFCIPRTASDAINTVAGLPGPAIVKNQGIVQFLCDGGAPYEPGVGCQ